MLRPGLRDPRMGPARSQALRRRVAEMIPGMEDTPYGQMPGSRKGRMMPAIARRPLLGGGFRRPVAGPGVRSMMGGRASPLNFLMDRAQMFGPGARPQMQPQPGFPQPGADLPIDPGVEQGDQAMFNPYHPTTLGPGGPAAFPQGPTHPLEISPARFPQNPAVQQLQSGASLIPLGGGQYIDTRTGQIHGVGGSGSQLGYY